MSSALQNTDWVRRLDEITADRDYWRAQHDVVMADWKADVDAWAADRAALHKAAASTEAARMLTDLLRFFDRPTGAISTRVGDETLNEAFLRASRLMES